MNERPTKYQHIRLPTSDEMLQTKKMKKRGYWAGLIGCPNQKSPQTRTSRAQLLVARLILDVGPTCLRLVNVNSTFLPKNSAPLHSFNHSVKKKGLLSPDQVHIFSNEHTHTPFGSLAFDNTKYKIRCYLIINKFLFAS